MRKLFLLSLIFVATAVIIISFFMPWAEVKTSVMGISKEVASAVKTNLGGLPIAGKVVGKIETLTSAISNLGDIEVKTTVRGDNIPMLVNNKTSKVAITLAQVLCKSAEDLDRKSYLVYLVPILGIACSILALCGLKNRFFIIIMSIISGGVSIGGLYNLYTIDIKTMIVEISIGKGLWYAMYSFLFIFLVGILWLIVGYKKSERDTRPI